MTTFISKFRGGSGASSSSIEADYLALSVDLAVSLSDLGIKAFQVNARQCQDLSIKILKVAENIQKLVTHSVASKDSFRPALQNLYRLLVNAKFLVHQCCDTDWCRSVVFQSHNEGAFREVLLELGLCFNVLYELTVGDGECRPLIRPEDLRQSSLFLPASESEVSKDREALKSRLERETGSSDDRTRYFARFILRKLEFMSEGRRNEDFSVADALLSWLNSVAQFEPQGTWKLRDVLGKGSGASCVFECDWFGISCARKEFHCTVPDAIFCREAAILAQLDHPNIVKFFGCRNDTVKGRCFIAMEIMETSLAALIRSRGQARHPFPILVVLDIMSQIARGVRYLHGLKIAHRDLKPQNVVVSKTPGSHLEDCFSVKLVDFGMSKTKVEVSKSNTISIPGVGTTKYRAPEVFPQAQGATDGMKRKVNWFLADAYSFGISCAALLSLKDPFDGFPLSTLYEDLVRGVRPVLPDDCPSDLCALLNKCWATDPKRRPSFLEICSRIENIKFQVLLRGSAGGVQGLLGSEYIETALVNPCTEHSECATAAPSLQSRRTSAVLLSSNDKESLWSLLKSSLDRAHSTLDLFKFGDGVLGREWKSILDMKCQELGVQPNAFSYNELGVATQNFQRRMLVGKSGYMTTFKGVLSSGKKVTVRRIKLGLFDIGEKEMNEVIHFSGVTHDNLVTLLGYCVLGHQVLLVHEFVNNLTLAQYLFGDQGSWRRALTWPTRLKICSGIALGLHFLTALARPRIIHGDIRPWNIFLDREMSPKIGGSSVAEVYPFEFPDEESVVKGQKVPHPRGHMAPEYGKEGGWSPKVDVYSFGLTCLEIISGRHWHGGSSDGVQYTAVSSWLGYLAWRLREEGRLSEFIDPFLRLTEFEVQSVHRVIEMCLMCVQTMPKERPTMTRVLSILEGERLLCGT